MSRKRLLSPPCIAAAAAITALLLIPPGLAASAAVGAATAERRQLDAEIRELAAEVLDIDQVAGSIAEHRRSSSDGALVVYIGSLAEGLRIRGASVQVDRGTPIHYQYSDQQSNLLQSGGTLHRLVEMPLAAGPHHLRVELVAAEANARLNTPSLRTSLDRSFNLQNAPTLIEVDLVQDGLLNKPAVKMREASDPQARAACFLAAGGENFLAGSGLLRLLVQTSGQHSELFCRDLAERMRGSGLSAGATASAAASDLSPAARYNAGVTALQGGNTEQGFLALDAIGQSKGTDSESLALRDKANLSLAYYLLRNGEPDKAIPRFDRIRSPGPYSNPALLGLGWAFLVPRGQKLEVPTAAGQEKLKFGAEDYEVTRLRRRMPFRYDRTVVTGERELDLRRALVPWVELIGRDPLDPAVQEGMLAIPYALGHLGAHQQAQTYYLRAIETLERVRGQLDQALQHAGDGRMASSLVGRSQNANSGWPVWLEDLPKARWWLKYSEAAPEMFYLEYLIEDGDFRQALGACRQLRMLGEVLDRHEQGIADLADGRELRTRITSLRPRIGIAYATRQQHLDDIARAALQQRKQQTEKYLAEARFAVARLNDRPPGGEVK